MDMNPITVLGGSSGTTPPASASTGAPKEPFAQVLSAHQTPEAKSSEPSAKVSPPDSDSGKKSTAKKAESPEPEDQDQKQQAGEKKQIVHSAIVPVIPVPSAPLDLSLGSLGLTGATEAADAKNSQEKAAVTASPIRTHIEKSSDIAGKADAWGLVATAGSINPEAASREVKGQNKTSQKEFSVAGKQIDVSDVKTDPALSDTIQAKIPTTAVDKQDAVKATKASTKSDTAALKHDAAKSNDPVAGDTAAAAPASQDADHPLSALKAAAEKIGAVVSATVHAGNQPSVGSHQTSAALKTAIAPDKIASAAGLPQVAEAGSSRQGESRNHDGAHANASKRDGSFADVSAQQATDSKTAGQDAASEAAAPNAVVNKAGAPQPSATGNANAVASQSTGGAQPGQTESADAGAKQIENPLPINHANPEATLDFGAWSKTSLIEKFRQTEMQFGMQAGEFGRIEVRTLLDRHEVTARISVERGDLSRALESELPGLQKRLSDLDVPVGKITLQEQSAAMSGESGRRSREQQWTNNQPIPQQEKTDFVPKAAIFAEQPISTEGLSIRI